MSRACSAPTSAVASLLRTRRGNPEENLLRSAAGRAVGAHKATRTFEVSTRSVERGASVLRGIGSRARMPRSRRRRHRRIDPGRSRIVRRASTPFALRQSPGGLPPRGVAVTMVSLYGYDARARSSRADPRQSRKPSLLRGLLARLYRQTAFARATGHGEPVAIGSPAELATWKLSLPRLVARGTEPPRVRVASRGKPLRIRVFRKTRTRCCDCNQSQRPSSSSPRGGLAASGCQSRQPRRGRVCRAGTPAKRQPLRRRGCFGLFLDRGGL